MVIIRMLLEVLGQLADTLTEDRNLNFGRTGVTFVGGIGGHDFVFLFFGNHCITPFFYSFSDVRAKGGKVTSSGGLSLSSARGLWYISRQ